MKFLHRKMFSVFAIILLTALTLFAQTEREKGIELYESGDYKAAIESLQKAVEADEKDNEAWRFLGMAFARTNDMEKARKAFDNSKNTVDGGMYKSFDKEMKIISNRKASYTEEARKNGVSGNVMLAVEFNRNGKIGQIFAYKELPDGLTENAVKTARKIKFEPAVKNGKAATVINFVVYTFDVY